MSTNHPFEELPCTICNVPTTFKRENITSPYLLRGKTITLLDIETWSCGCGADGGICYPRLSPLLDAVALSPDTEQSWRFHMGPHGISDGQWVREA